MGYYQDTFDTLHAEFAAVGAKPRMLILSLKQAQEARAEGARNHGVSVEIVPDWDGPPTLCDDLSMQEYFDRRASYTASVTMKHRQGGHNHDRPPECA